MNIKIEGNPGTGNTFVEVNIDSVQNYNPNATVVNNYYNGDQHKPAPRDAEPSLPSGHEVLRAQICDYVRRLERYVAPEWASRYVALWGSILDAPVVEAVIYNPGKQQGTTFNRNLVASIIYIMCSRGILPSDNVTRLTEWLEGDKEHSVRAALGRRPDDEGICECVNALIDASDNR